ncbi:uncharacterized protein LOC132265984 [Phlebotomus argentipes]|uniref:uncharacterized protein LOC132265984 n=1 Tax=Phlebotomus argentipes TaxID=94469 RepID=UPI002892EC29|nr:uncharacterized protein LOC132265984 [Phlebotomus argentipes]
MDLDADKINPFARSRRIQAAFRDSDKKGEVAEAVSEVEEAKSHLPRYGECWKVLTDGLYQQAKFAEAATVACDRNFNDCVSWERTIKQTLQDSLGKAGQQRIAKTSKFLVKKNHAEDAKDTKGPCEKFGNFERKNKHSRIRDPLEEKRLRDLRKVTDQMYLKQLSSDVEFMKGLLVDKRLDIRNKSLPEHSRKVNKEIKAVLRESLEKCAAWKTQLHLRTPLYVRQEERFITRSAKMQAIETHLQQMKVINQVKARRLAEELTTMTEIPRKLLKYIDNAIRPFYCAVTEKSFPAVGDFVERVMELAGEAYIREMIGVEIENGREGIGAPHLLKLPKRTQVTHLDSFTDRERVKELESHLEFVRFPLEKAYIMYKIFTIQSKTLPEKSWEVSATVEKISEPARKVGSPSWCFLSTIANAQVLYTRSEYDETELCLMEAMEITRLLPKMLAKGLQAILSRCHRNLLREMRSRMQKLSSTNLSIECGEKGRDLEIKMHGSAF